MEIQSNNLTYQGNPYTAYQQYLYTLIKCLHDKGYGYRRIAHKLNTWQVKTARGNRWYNTSVTSVLKRKHQRDARIEKIRHKEYPIKIGKFKLKYYTY
ncbi:recombinase family protein [Candidatus Pseudothioglobus sp. Uisw_050_01]|uniref:recombinase family protein n=1 Tax=Candidatus Pseudothioglobus sp. Uisw_050_01 TaxID=3230997 RepID=UPI003A8A7454